MMKAKYVILLFAQWFSLISFSQILVRENIIWSSVIFEGPESLPFYTHHTKFEGDTMIQSVSYKKIYRSNNEMANNWSLWCEFIREKDGKVFVYNGGLGNEYLYYDFNLSEGDSFYIYWQHPPEDDPFIVDSIRAKEIHGKSYKHWFLSWWEHKEVWVEKIGSFNDILLPIGLLGGAVEKLLCVTETGELIYQNEQYNTCFMKSNEVSVFEQAQQLLKVLPVTGEELLLQLSPGDVGNFSLYTPNGKRILKCLLTAPETTLCAPGTGLYLYRFVSEKGGVQSGKVVVE